MCPGFTWHVIEVVIVKPAPWMGFVALLKPWGFLFVGYCRRLNVYTSEFLLWFFAGSVNLFLGVVCWS